MKNIFDFRNFNRVAVLIILLSLIIGIFTSFQRANVESDYKNVEISLDYDEMNKFAKQTDTDLSFWLKKFSELGAQSVLLPEETINTLINEGNEVNRYFLNDLLNDIRWEDIVPEQLADDIKDGKITNDDVIIGVKDLNVYDYIIDGLNLRYPVDIFELYESNNVKFIVLFGVASDSYYGSSQTVYSSSGDSVTTQKKMVDSRLLNIGIGYSKEKINLIKECGLDIILRPVNYSRYTDKLVDAYKYENERYGIKPRVYVVNGKEVLGYPDNLNLMSTYMNENDIKSVLIETGNQRENIEQKGLKELITDTKYNTARAFTMWNWIRLKYQAYGYEGAEEIENSIYRAVTERNIRLVVFKPFFEDNNIYLTDVAEYERTFKSLSDRLSQHGMSYGPAGSMVDFHIGNTRLGVLCVGVAVACVFLFNNVLSIRNMFGKVLYGLSLFAFFAPFVARGLSQTVFPFFAAIAYSGIAIYYFMSMIKKIKQSNKKLGYTQLIIKSCIILVTSCIISIGGAICVVSILSDITYMLELNIFRGVKLAQLVPFMIFILILLLQYINDASKDNSRLKDVIEPIGKLLNANVKIYYVLLAGILMIAGYIYIARTGHETNVQASQLELMVRNFLENILIARPRSKEFLIAFPALFAAVFAANRKIPLLTELCMLASAIGTSSIINTFCHIRTPLYLSIDRTLISMLFGIIIGCIVIIILDILYKIYFKLQERLK